MTSTTAPPSRSHFDPAPFAPYLPPAVAELVVLAEKKEGPLAGWMFAEGPHWARRGQCYSLLRGHPSPLAPEIVGWVVGMTLFEADSHDLVDVMEREQRFEPAPFALEAMACGLAAGLVAGRRQWQTAARLAKLSRAALAPSLIAQLPLGLCAASATDRGAALTLAQAAGAAARSAIERATHDASAKERRLLEQALTALSGGAGASSAAATPNDLLTRLVAAYDATLDPALIQPIEALGAAEARARGPLTSTSKAELEGAWLSLIERRDPGDVDRLMDAAWPGTWKTAMTRLKALRALPSDPRVAKKLDGLLGRYDSQAAEPFRREARLLMRRMTREKLADAPPALLTEATALVPRRSGGDPTSLLADVIAEPSSDERRAVLADALQALGDPRGEYIALALAIARGEADAATKKRASALLKANIDGWSGPLPGVELGSRAFERGFLARVRLVVERPADLMRALDAPAWALLEELRLGGQFVHPDPGDAMGRLVARCRNLRVLSIQLWGREETGPGLFAHGPFPSVRSLGSGDWLDPAAARASFPSLELYGTFAERGGVAIERARRLGVRTALVFGVDGLAESLGALDGAPIDELRVALQTYARGGHPLEPATWVARFRLGVDEVDLHWPGSRYGKDTIEPALDVLASVGRRRVAIASPAQGGDALRAAANERAAELGLTVRYDAAGFDPWRR